MVAIKVKKVFNVCNLYIFLWLLYNFHWNEVGRLFPIIDSLSNVFLAINLLISAYCTVKVLTSYSSNQVFKYINILLVLFIFYGFFSIVQGSRIIRADTGTSIKSGTYIVAALRSYLPIYTCFLFTKLGYITEKTMRTWFWVFLAQSIFIYMLFRTILGLSEMDDMLTNNRGYLFVYIFPYVFLFRKKIVIQFALAVLFLFFTVFSIKRGAILVSSLAFLYMLLDVLKNASSTKKTWALILFVVLVGYGSVVIERMYENSIVFQHRVENTMEGRTSGRDEIAGNLLDIYVNSDIPRLIFGYGADGTLKFGNYAHSDWLEMLFDQGLLGFSVYFLFWFSVIRLWRRQVKFKTDLALFWGLIIICSFTKSLFSMWYSMANIFITMPFGYCIAKIFSRKAVNYL